MEGAYYVILVPELKCVRGRIVGGDVASTVLERVETLEVESIMCETCYECMCADVMTT